jgi:hypothetical protein
MVQKCDSTLETEYLNNHPVPEPATCLHNEGAWGIIRAHCSKITLAWATGGDYDVTFPKEYGFPMGGEHQGSKHFFIEIHYENPAMEKSMDIYCYVNY